jgi:hypothetical protein
MAKLINVKILLSGAYQNPETPAWSLIFPGLAAVQTSARPIRAGDHLEIELVANQQDLENLHAFCKEELVKLARARAKQIGV